MTDAPRLAVGPGVILSYTWPGLAHPARRIREAYWRIYNQTFMRHAGAMTPFCASKLCAHRSLTPADPRFASDARNDYERTMLDLCVCRVRLTDARSWV